MHDLHEADKILKAILQAAQEHNFNKVTAAGLELGEIMEHGELIQPENLQFNVKLLAQNTLARNLKLEITSVPGNNWKLAWLDGE
jgi:Zn finger protein HypA/HybF involved in hydrogenase expression